MILVLHAVNRSGLVMDGTRYIGAAERAEAWLSRPWRRSVQGHRLFESGRVGATVAELRRDRENEKQPSLSHTAPSKLRDRGTRN